MSSIEERRARHARYKKDVDRRGKPFFPYAMFHDTVMSLIVVCVIAGLAAIWRFTPDFGACDAEGIGKRDCTETGLLGPLYADKADPGTTSFVPRPDWYFYFLFYLLRIFKWPDSVILGTVGIPTIILVLMLLLPFVDRRRERRLLRRPVAIVITILTVMSMGILTWKGATVREFLASEVKDLPAQWAKKQGFEGNADALAGAETFSEAGCLTCHTYLGTGSSNLGAPDLSAEGVKGKGIEFQIKHLRDPRSTTPGSQMLAFAALGDDVLRKLAIFLEASKGPK